MQAAVVGACMLVLVAGDLQGFAMTNHKLCAHETVFSSFMFPDHVAHMSFAARGQKLHMLFGPLELPYSDKVLAV